jgi:hypothetical protein
MARRSSAAAIRSALLVLGGLAAGALPAQAPALPAQAPALRAQAPAADGPITLTTPDGSRFVLLPDSRMELVHWAIATVAHDPPGFAGLSAATMLAALGGTWRSGSHDPERERPALADLDTAFHAWLGNRGDAAATAELVRRSTAVEQLGDPASHRRVLASVPLHLPEVFDRPPVCLYVTSTVPAAVPEVARLLLERREQTALRDLQTIWAQTGRPRQDDRTALRAEVLALAMPDHPFLRRLERPGSAAPRRAEAMSTWQAMQRPERTVHVLHGGFDAAAVQALLTRTFTTTMLPPAEPLPVVSPRPFSSLRRSVVPGARVPTVALGFVLPPGVDRAALDVASRWLGGGADSRLGRELPRLGHPQATVECHAPWPPTIGGSSLLLLEVADPDGIDGLAEVIRRFASEAIAAAPSAEMLDAALAEMQREWTRVTNDPRQFAVAVAEAAQLWPQQPPRTTLPDRIDGEAVRRLLGQILDSQPVIVEARP